MVSDEVEYVFFQCSFKNLSNSIVIDPLWQLASQQPSKCISNENKNA